VGRPLLLAGWKAAPNPAVPLPLSKLPIPLLLSRSWCRGGGSCCQRGLLLPIMSPSAGDATTTPAVPLPLMLSHSCCWGGCSYWRGGRPLPLLLSRSRCRSGRHRSFCPAAAAAASFTLLLSGRPFLLARQNAAPAPAVGGASPAVGEDSRS